MKRAGLVALLLLALMQPEASRAGPCDPPRVEEKACIPTTLREALSALDRVLSETEEFLYRIEGDPRGESHMGLGLWLRNNWLRQGLPLWDYFRAKGIPSKDDMSGVVIHAYHQHLNGLGVREDDLIAESIRAAAEVAIPTDLACPDDPVRTMAYVGRRTRFPKTDLRLFETRHFAYCPDHRILWARDALLGWHRATADETRRLTPREMPAAHTH